MVTRKERELSRIPGVRRFVGTCNKKRNEEERVRHERAFMPAVVFNDPAIQILIQPIQVCRPVQEPSKILAPGVAI